MALFDDLVFSEEFNQAYELMENSHQHVFITGRAGTGKSTLLQYFRQKTKKNIVVLAPTGIAALNVKGQTIHSFFKFPPHPIHSSDITKRRNRKVYEKLDAIVIDEISMVRADLLDAINHFMRINGLHRSSPFGGVQMIFIGDLFQLPPIVSSAVEKQLFSFLYETPFFFSAHVLQNLTIQYVELREVYRQKDQDFLQILDKIRLKQVDSYSLQVLNQQHRSRFIPTPKQAFIYLVASNAMAQQINEEKLEALPAEEVCFKAEVEGKFQQKQFPNDEELLLKEGAQVMFIRNDLYKRWVNGTLGTIFYVDEDTISVSINTDKGEVKHTVEKETWEILKYAYDEKEQKITTEVLGSFTQYPLKLAWAITIHKSQGKTFERIIVDLGYRGAFAPGQVYVALSRCTSLEGIVLKRPIRRRDIIVDRRIKQFAEATGLYQ